MIEILSVEDMRASDAAAIAGGIPQPELMRRAGKAIFDTMMSLRMQPDRETPPAASPVCGNGAGKCWQPPVAIVCGKGNNGGDGLELAKLLEEAGIAHTVFRLYAENSKAGFTSEPAAASGANNAESAGSGSFGKPGFPVPDFSGFPTIVDCIFGTGFHGGIRPAFAEVIRVINASGAYVISVDINSGLNGNSGLAAMESDGTSAPDSAQAVCRKTESVCVRSDLTVSIGSFQPGHFLAQAGDVMQSKVNCDIGIAPASKPYYLFEKEDAARIFTPRKKYSNKADYGYIALIGGSARYGGAIRLAAMANAAMRAGAGVVKLAVPKGLCSAIRPEILESTLFPLRDRDCDLIFEEAEFAELIASVRVIAFGMGIGKTAESAKALRYLLDNFRGTLIIDADGLNVLAEMTDVLVSAVCSRIILTPHPKEFSRLSGMDTKTVLEHPALHAAAYARKHKVIVLLKGTATVITDGETVYLTDRGCAGMATAGSGDVLSGVIAAVCGSVKTGSGTLQPGSVQPGSAETEEDAAGSDPLLTAVASASWITGLAGELAQAENGDISMVASDTAKHLRDALKTLRE